VRVLLNLIWLVFGGLLMALGYAVVALVMFVLIITIPFGIASARIALFCLWPFGRTIVRRPDAGAGSLLGNVIWFVLAGWWLALGHLVTGVLMCLTIIGIPLGLAGGALFGGLGADGRVGGGGGGGGVRVRSWRVLLVDELMAPSC
jgi:uncharacterized membrane protein YccF (DUF307 family)